MPYILQKVCKILEKCTETLQNNRKDDFLHAVQELSVLDFANFPENSTELHSKQDQLQSKFNGTSDLRLISNELIKILSLAIIPEFSKREHFTFEASDFKGWEQKTELTLVLLKILLEKLKFLSKSDQSMVKSVLETALPEILILLSSNSELNLWCSAKTEKVNIIWDMLRQIYECDTENLHCILFPQGGNYTPASTVFGRYLKMVTARLHKHNWMKNPNIQKSFQWMLKQVKFPHLSNFLDVVLPPALNFVDDFEVMNKSTGVICLHHLIVNVSNEELRWYGRAEVIYDVLYKQLFNHDIMIIRVLHPTMLSLLPIFGKLPQPIEKHHRVFQTILRDVEFENKILTRRCLTENLPQIVELLGISVIKHSKKLMNVFESYLEIFDGPEEIARMNILKTLEMFLKVAWPRVPQYTMFLSKILFKFICDISTDKTTTNISTKVELISAAKNCLLLIKICDPNIHQFLATIKNMQMNRIVEKVITDIESHESTGTLPKDDVNELTKIIKSLNI